MPPQDAIAEYNFALCDCGSGFFTPHTGKYQIARVKFGVPLEEVCKNDIPGPLLVLILKLNKEAPHRKDVFRAPGHHVNMKKLIHFLQTGRLVNIDNFSVHTIASVLKKFLRKLPEGIFGRDGEKELFQVIDMTNLEEQRDHVHALISSLPVNTQRLIVLLFGTFRVIASNAERNQNGMTSESLGVSVAPSFFHSCVADGRNAKMEDVLKYKVATKIMKFLIDNFGVSNLFGRENYEYYARITGRILKVEEEWIFSFRYPPDYLVSPMSQQEESQSTPALLQSSERLDVEAGQPSSSLGIIPENNLLESYTRLSISLEDNGLFQDTIEQSSRSSSTFNLDELRAVNPYAESTKSLTFLPQVHERQAARMKTRSEWFLSPSPGPNLPLVDIDHDVPNQYYILREEANRNQSGFGGLFSSSAESLKHLVRRSSSKEKDRRLVRRTSSKKNKENGNGLTGSNSNNKSKSSSSTSSPSQQAYASTQLADSPPEVDSADAPIASSSSNCIIHVSNIEPSEKISGDGSALLESEAQPLVVEDDCTETDVKTFHVTLTYKPRI